MKITPSLAGRYRPRVSATYPLLSARLRPGKIDRFDDGFLTLSGTSGRLLLSDGVSTLQVRTISTLAAPMAVQVQGRALRASPLIGTKVSARTLTSALRGSDITRGKLLLSDGVSKLLFSDGVSFFGLSRGVPNVAFLVGKNVSDTATFSDSVVFSVSAVQSSTMVGGDSFSSIGAGVLSLTSNGAAVDSGLIFTQEYADTTDYFAQDYVGTSRSF